MSDYSASQVPKISSAISARPTSAVEGAQSSSATARLTQSNAATTSSTPMSNSSTSSSPASSSPATSSPTNTFNNVYSQAPAESASVAVKFIEDPETKAVTVFVIDRASNKVVRTIPQNEMNNMRPGSLLEITA